MKGSLITMFDTYLGYMARQEELDEIVERIVAEAIAEQTLDFTLTGDFTSGELDYIKSETERRLGA
jgi:hypothetical protein